MIPFKKILLYINTVKYIKLYQILSRVNRKLRGMLRSYQRRFLSLSYKGDGLIPLRIIKPALLLQRFRLSGCIERAEEILNNQFKFLNRGCTFRNKVDWNPEGFSRLWVFNLHYFDYGLDLAIAYYRTGKKKYFDKFKDLVEDWIEGNNIVQDDAWHPYTTSRRIVNWIFSFHLIQRKIERKHALRIRLLESIYLQTVHLYRNLEYDVSGNHLLANGKALFIAGAFLGKERYLKKGLEILKDEIKKQILPDGGHFELSPMYHCQVLLDLLDCFAVLPPGSPVYKLLKEKLKMMLGFLKNILAPNKEIPLFSDSTKNGTISPIEIFNYAENLGFDLDEEEAKLILLDKSGYYIVRSEDIHVIIDGGKIGADCQAGHGHCDLFSYEFWLKGKKVVTDSGTYNYEKSEIRDYCRSTAAHNTLRIDGKEQSEIWGTFRVGRRVKPKYVRMKETDKIIVFSGIYSPYFQRNIIHKRCIFIKSKKIFLVLDRVYEKEQVIRKYQIENFIHLNPELRLDKDQKKGIVLIHEEDLTLNFIPINSVLNVVDGWYCPEFGRRIVNKVIVLKKHGNLPLTTGYLFLLNPKEEVKMSEINGKIRIEIEGEDPCYF